MVDAITIGLFVFVGVALLRALLAPPAPQGPQVIYVQAVPPPAGQAQQGGNLGCLLFFLAAAAGAILLIQLP